MIPLSHYLVVSALLFAIGTAGVFLRKNLITILLSVEIMLNANGLLWAERQGPCMAVGGRMGASQARSARATP